jgi:hypothetical protein
MSKDYAPARLALNSSFRRLFEFVVQASLKGLYGGDSFRFGWPNEYRDWPRRVTNPADRLGELANRLGLDTTTAATQTAAEAFRAGVLKATDKDLGLDVVARLHRDGLGGSVYLLAQCATGSDWQKEKQGHPPEELWSNLLVWDSIRVRVIALPYAISERSEIRRISMFFGSIVFDRLRLLAGRPDEHLPAWCGEDLRGWCATQLPKIPAH